MCKWVSNIFKSKAPLPYPEEPTDPNATVATISAHGLIEIWLIKYRVPAEHHGFWRSIKVDINHDIKSEVTYSEIRLLVINPAYANPGVLAHGCAHISYQQLSSEQKVALYREYEKRRKKLKGYAKQSVLEFHADNYRYYGDQMEESLKIFYPGLL